MSKINLILIPPPMTKLINENMLSLHDLMDLTKLRSILSDLSVSKYCALNTSSNPVPAGQSCCCGEDILYVNKLKEYVSPMLTEEMHKSNINFYKIPVLDSLCEVGNEALNPVLTQKLHNYALTFDVVLICANTYGVMFKNLCEVNTPCKRLDLFKQDLHKLLVLVSNTMSDKELLNEPLYHEYLSQM